MTEKEISEKIQKVISLMTGKPIQSIKNDADLVRKFNLDSLDLLQVFYDAKKEFNISLTEIEEDLYAEIFLQKPTIKTLTDIIKEILKDNPQNSQPTDNVLQQPVLQPDTIVVKKPEETSKERALQKWFNNVKQRIGKIFNAKEQNTK